MNQIHVVLILSLALTGTLATNPCVRKDFGKTSFVCVCNSTYCDDFDVIQPVDFGQAVVVTSDIKSRRFDKSQLSFVDSPDNNETERIVLTLNPNDKYQTILGWGGAFTDAAGINIARLNDQAQNLLIRTYYDVTGLDYNIGRINMGGCDFSPRGYTYLDTEGDIDLETFSLQEEDFKFKIPYLKMAEGLRSEPLKLFASPWSAPKWMKSNNDLIGKGVLLPQNYQVWANYFIRFLDEYKSNGITFWGLTAQNEPVDGLIPGFSFNCMGWNATTQRIWVVDHLGPSMEAAGYSDVKLMIFDDQRPLAPQWTREVFEDERALQYVDGIAVHWYMDRWFPIPSALDEVHNDFPDKFILYTEACTGDTPFDLEKVMLGSWRRGEDYLNNIIEDLNHWTVGWVDWNLALDLQGGPNWAGNFVDAPVIVDEENGVFYKQPMYYALGHVTRFVPPESKRVGLNQNVRLGELKTVAFQKPDGGFSIILLNRNHDDAIHLTIEDPERGFLDLDLEPQSFTSVVFW